jgi:putative toxin-antitoxin system antitoxin component (TIGR02293 family)
MVMSLVERLGGAEVLNREIGSEAELAEIVRGGFAYGVLDHVIQSNDLKPSEVYALIGTRRTLMRKKREGTRLSPSESGRLARIVATIDRAEAALGDRDVTRRWLRKPNRALAGKRPIDLLGSDAGTRMVEHIVGQLERGAHR